MDKLAFSFKNSSYNLKSKTPFYNIGFDAGIFMITAIPTRFPQDFLNSKFFINVKS